MFIIIMFIFLCLCIKKAYWGEGFLLLHENLAYHIFVQETLLPCKKENCIWWKKVTDLYYSDNGLPHSARLSLKSTELGHPPPFFPGGTHSLGGEGVGGANSDERTDTLYSTVSSTPLPLTGSHRGRVMSGLGNEKSIAKPYRSFHRWMHLCLHLKGTQAW